MLEYSAAEVLAESTMTIRKAALMLTLCRAGHAVEEAAVFLFFGRLLRLDLLLGSLQIIRQVPVLVVKDTIGLNQVADVV